MRIILVVLVFFLAACTTETAEQQTTENMKVNTDIEQLQRLIALPKMPLKSTWSIKEYGAKGGFGSNDWALVAILEFDSETIKQLSKTKSSVDKASLLPAMDWYPENFVKQLEKTSDGQYKSSSSRFSADAFFSSPLLNGYFIPIQGTNNVFLYLYTM